MRVLWVLLWVGLIAAFSGAAFSAEKPKLDKSQAVLRQLELLQVRITELESDSGPYDTRLLEPLQALSELYLTAEDFEAVAEIQSRQLQIMRAELGLDHPDNIAMVNSIISNNIRMAQWSEVEDSLEHIRYLEGVNVQGNPEPLLRAIEAQASWSIAQIAVAEPRLRARNLLDARESYKDIKELAQDAFGEENSAMVPWLYKRAVNLFQIVAALNSDSGLAGDTLARVIQLDGVARLEAYNSRARFAGGSFFDRNPQIPVLDSDALIGEAYLRDALAELKTITEMLDESGDIEAQAMSHVYYGDFRILVGLGSGKKSYLKAHDLLREAGISEGRISQFFDVPRIIPAEVFSFNLAQAETANNTAMVQSISDKRVLISEFTALEEDAGNVSMPASFTGRWGLKLPSDVVEMTVNVSSRGVVSAPKFVAASSDDKSIRRKALRSVRGLRFRPRFEDGKAVRVRGMKLSYRFEEGSN
jgi:hypothetical protein|tara:strand:- start:91 stop:1512 length:1422 start_codon:yes stop_codon:yes gene_type:complete